MTRDRLIIADASKVSPIDFLRAITGKPPLTQADNAQREAEHQAWLVKHREESRRELEELRDRLCKLASPELAAKFRADWAEQDAIDERRAMPSARAVALRVEPSCTVSTASPLPSLSQGEL